MWGSSQGLPAKRFPRSERTNEWQNNAGLWRRSDLSNMALLPKLSIFITVLIISSCWADVKSSSSSHSSSSTSTESESTANASTATVTTLPIVTWKWHHVETPYLVALWIFVCWLCKLGKHPASGSWHYWEKQERALLPERQTGENLLFRWHSKYSGFILQSD